MSQPLNYFTRDPQMTKTTLIALAILSFAAAGCSKADAPRASADKVTEIELADVPQSVQTLVLSARDGFEMVEVLKKVRGDRTYYDVEGELPSGDEIEFDVLMTAAGPEIVEIQRDIIWRDVPKKARKVVNAANTDKLEIVRIIESTQTDDSIIYEIFVAGHKSDPRFEAHMKDGKAELLTSRWKH